MDNPVVRQHRAVRTTPLTCAVVTISDTRTWETDRGGEAVARLLSEAGHTVAYREIVPDESERIAEEVRRAADPGRIELLLMTGGTGIGPRDCTYETVRGLLTRELPGYGELFRWLSFQEIGPAAMLSRALAGVVDSLVVVTLPGSPSAISLAMHRLILPEAGHLVAQARG